MKILTKIKFIVFVTVLPGVMHPVVAWAQNAPSSASDGLSALPESCAAAFEAVDADPHPEKLTRDSHYWISDEQRHDLFRKAITNKGGVFVGLGTDQNYLMAAWSKPQVLVPLDFDQMVVSLHYVFRVIFLNAKDPATFIQMWSEENFKSTKALLKQAYADKDEQFQKDVYRAFKQGSKFVRRRIVRIQKVFGRVGVPTFLTDQAQYDFIVGLFKANRVFPVRGDLTATKTVRQVGDASRKCGLTIRTLYLSNAEQYFKYTPDFRENMQSLPYDTESVVIRTAGTKKPWTADGVYDYMVQTADNFMTWLKHKQTYNVWTIVAARTVNEKTGGSVVTKVPEEK